MAQNWALAGMVAALLLVATTIGQIIKSQPQLGLNPAAVAAFNCRLRSWWIICCMLSVAFLPIRVLEVGSREIDGHCFD